MGEEIDVMGIGIWDNLANYQNGWVTTGIDLAGFGISIGVGTILGVIGTPVVAAGIITVAAGAVVTWRGSIIKDAYFSKRK